MSTQLPKRTRIIHISDPHVWSSETYAKSAVLRRAKKRGAGIVKDQDLEIRSSSRGFLGSFQRRNELQTICQSIVSQFSPRTDVVLITGDIVEGNASRDGIDKEYEAARRAVDPLLRAGFDLHVVPGNHDVAYAGNVFNAYALTRFKRFSSEVTRYNGQPYRSSAPYSVEYEDFRMILLNSAAPEGRGQFSARGRIGRQTALIEGELVRSKADGRPLILAMHHHPDTRSASGQMFLRIEDAEDLLALVKTDNRFREVKKIVCCGHKHKQSLDMFAMYSHNLFGVAADQCTTSGSAIVFSPSLVFSDSARRQAGSVPDIIDVRYTARPGLQVIADAATHTVRSKRRETERFNVGRRMRGDCIIDDVQLEEIDAGGVNVGRIIETDKTKFGNTSGARVERFGKGGNDLSVEVTTWNDRKLKKPLKYRLLYYVRPSRPGTRCAM